MSLSKKEFILNFILPASAAVVGGVILGYIQARFQEPMGSIKKLQVGV